MHKLKFGLRLTVCLISLSEEEGFVKAQCSPESFYLKSFSLRPIKRDIGREAFAQNRSLWFSVSFCEYSAFD